VDGGADRAAIVRCPRGPVRRGAEDVKALDHLPRAPRRRPRLGPQLSAPRGRPRRRSPAPRRASALLLAGRARSPRARAMGARRGSRRPLTRPAGGCRAISGSAVRARPPIRPARVVSDRNERHGEGAPSPPPQTIGPGGDVGVFVVPVAPWTSPSLVRPRGPEEAVDPGATGDRSGSEAVGTTAGTSRSGRSRRARAATAAATKRTGVDLR
jgi:hypothetical protein